MINKTNNELLEFTNNQLEIVIRAKNCMNLFNSIYPNKNNRLNDIFIQYGDLFSFIQILAIDGVISCLYKLIKDSRNNHYNLKLLKKDFGVLINEDIKNIIDDLYKKLEVTRPEFKKNLLDRIIDYRDKFIGHTDFDRKSNKYEARAFPAQELFPLIDELHELIIEIRKNAGISEYAEYIRRSDSLINTDSFFIDLLPLLKNDKNVIS